MKKILATQWLPVGVGTRVAVADRLVEGDGLGPAFRVVVADPTPPGVAVEGTSYCEYLVTVLADNDCNQPSACWSSGGQTVASGSGSYSPDEGPMFRQYGLVSGRGNDGDRFRDPLVWVERFADEVLVRCPTCGECAIVLDHLGAREYQASRDNGRLVARRRLRCLACGLSKDGFPSERVFGIPVDPYFRLPLWLQADCCGKLLWAYNTDHLDLLEPYVAARLRERSASPGSMSMLARLPSWLKSAKNRDEILRDIRRLRSSLPTARQ